MVKGSVVVLFMVWKGIAMDYFWGTLIKGVLV